MQLLIWLIWFEMKNLIRKETATAVADAAVVVVVERPVNIFLFAP